LAAEAAGIGLLEQFPEIIDTEKDDHETTQGIGHRVKDPRSLDKQDIYEKEGGIAQKAVEQYSARLLVPDDHPEQIAIKSEIQDREEVAQNQVIDAAFGHIAGYGLCYEIDQKEYGENLEITLGTRRSKNGEADQEGDGREDGGNIEEVVYDIRFAHSPAR
jgi:hypothetical protein